MPWGMGQTGTTAVSLNVPQIWWRRHTITPEPKGLKPYCTLERVKAPVESESTTGPAWTRHDRCHRHVFPSELRQIPPGGDVLDSSWPPRDSDGARRATDGLLCCCLPSTRLRGRSMCRQPVTSCLEIPTDFRKKGDNASNIGKVCGGTWMGVGWAQPP